MTEQPESTSNSREPAPRARLKVLPRPLSKGPAPRRTGS